MAYSIGTGLKTETEDLSRALTIAVGTELKTESVWRAHDIPTCMNNSMNFLNGIPFFSALYSLICRRVRLFLTG